MNSNRKNPKADLDTFHTLFIEFGLIAALLVFIVAMKVDLKPKEKVTPVIDQQEIVTIEDVVQTKQINRPPPPPRPPVPVEVPNDEIIEEQILNIDADFEIDEELELPEEAPAAEEKEDFFVAVEQMPELIGGLAALQKNIQYPEMARKAGIEGRVIVQFIVNQDGSVENPRVIRGIGGGCDEEALRAVSNAKFEPGRQRGQAVRVQYSLPVVFRLQN